jgi:23S rRNA maturation mini-RNase III
MVEVQNSFNKTQKTCKNLTNASIRLRDENISLKADFTAYIQAAKDQCRVFEDVIPMFSAERSSTFRRLQNTMEQIKQKNISR